MEYLFWTGKPLLDSLGAHEPTVEDLRDSMRHAIRQSLIPLAAYARQYEKYISLAGLDIQEYLK